MRLKISLFVVLMVAVSSQSSFAALYADLEIVGETQGWIKGDDPREESEGLIRVIAYDHIVSSTREPDTCMPSRLNHLPLQITKDVDKSTPLLYEAFANNEMLTTFVLRFWRLDPAIAVEAPFYTIELRNARIVGIHQEMLNNRNLGNQVYREMEHISFVYERIIRTIEEVGVLVSENRWESDCGMQIRLSDLNFDGIVNILDLAIMANEWLYSSL